MTAPESRTAEQSVREVAEMIAKFRTPPGLTWADLANDIETFVNAKLTTSAAAVAAMREALTWRPIETAPDNEQIIIGWHNPNEADGLDDIDIASGFTKDSYFNHNNNLVRRTPNRLWPTHWLKIVPCRALGETGET